MNAIDQNPRWNVGSFSAIFFMWRSCEQWREQFASPETRWKRISFIVRSLLVVVLLGLFTIAISMSLPSREIKETDSFPNTNFGGNNHGLLFELFDNAVLSGSPPLYEGITSSATLSLKPPQHVPCMANDALDITQEHSTIRLLSGALKGSLSIEQRGKQHLHGATKNRKNWYIFECSFEGTATGWVKIGSHIVCHDGNAYHYQQQEALPLQPNKQYTFHAILTSNVTDHMGTSSSNVIERSNAIESNLTTKVPRLSVYWKRAREREEKEKSVLVDSSNSDNGSPLDRGFRILSSPSSGERDDDSIVLDPNLPSNEKQRQNLQNRVSRGWGHWLVNDLLSVTKLPEGIVVGLQICAEQSENEDQRDCVGPIVPDSEGIVKVDRYSTNRSYSTFNITFTSAQGDSIALTLEFSMTGPDHEVLQCLITVIDCDSTKDFELEVRPRYAWFRPGKILSTSRDLRFLTPGLDDIDVHVLLDDGMANKNSFHPTNSSVGNSLRIPLANKGQKVGVLAGPSSTLLSNHANLPEVERHIRAMDIMDESAMKEAFGKEHQVAEAIRAAVMWSRVYNPIEEGPFMPVSRSPSWAETFASKADAATPDWNYVLFEWDNLFASLMAGLFDKNIAYSNLFVLVRSKTPDGFLPNWSTAGGIRRSGDRTEPPVGAKILLELYKKYNDSWIVEALWEDLAEWNDWFMRERTLQPLNLISLGSYENRSSSGEAQQNTLQAARYESGLDNSPMYDGSDDEIYDEKGHMMKMYDVGMSSLVANEAYSLAQLADAVGIHSEKAKLLRTRGDKLRDNIWKNLWDPKRNIFANRYKNLSFVQPITPTSFYPLILPPGNSSPGESLGAEILTDVETMIGSWLLNATRFCLAPNGDFEGNDPNFCYWGLPSVSADDPTYMATGHWNYWRGLVWGPMAQIVYWSLEEPLQPLQNSLPAAISFRRETFSTNRTMARKSLCSQMKALMMSQWKSNRHICENYSPFQNATDCSGTLFYHWGALNGLIGILENGSYYETVDDIFLKSK